MKGNGSCRLQHKKGKTQLIIHSQKGQSLNLREAEDIQNGVMEGVIPVEIKMKGKGFVLTYNVTNYISLEQYVHTIVSRKKFVEIMLQILHTFQCMAEKFYHLQNLVLDLDKVFVNPSKNNILFVFVPILYYDDGESIQNFLIRLIYETTFDSSENIDYVEKCLQILKRNMNFSRVELEEFLKETQQEGRREEKKERKEEIKASIAGKGIYDPAVQKGFSFKEEDLLDYQRGAAGGRSTHMTESLSDTGRGDTAVLGKAEASYIKQVSTDKIFYLENQEISVGKRQCNIEINGNPAVSRRHALLCRTEKGWAVMDLNATNGTKVNGKRIKPNEKILLQDEDTLEFADEQFVFYE